MQVVKEAHLRGRGGAGYPTGLKWEHTRQQPGTAKFIICNADEGDPGAFMDRTMLEGDPHRLLEGMLIAARAIGASRGYIYVRAEYPLAVKTLRQAIAQAQEYGVMGHNILGSGMDFDITIKEGAGAFVCGEETALIHSIEGQRGMPRMRPPYPSVHGLWGCPTNINNVETYCSVPSILLQGPGWFAEVGTARSGGTKAFALTGAIKNSGLVEVPLGMALRELIGDIGGGCQSGRTFKAVQLGGPSGGCLPPDLLETRIDYEDVRATGAIMGSGGMVVVDDTTCMVDFTRFFLAFTQDESCGKCVPCRVGMRKMLGFLTRITHGQAEPNVLSGYQPVGDATARQGMAQAWGGADLPATPGLTVVEMMHAAVEGKIHAMYIMGENPMLSDPNITQVEAALRALDFLVVQDIFLSETAQLAHVVLPAASALEKDGTFTNTERRVQRLAPVLPSPGAARADWQILFLSFHWKEAPANMLTQDFALDPLAKIPEYKVCAVRLERPRSGAHGKALPLAAPLSVDADSPSAGASREHRQGE